MNEDLMALGNTCAAHDIVLAQAIGLVMKQMAEASPERRHLLAAGLTAIGQNLHDADRTPGKIMLEHIARSAGMA